MSDEKTEDTSPELTQEDFQQLEARATALEKQLQAKNQELTGLQAKVSETQAQVKAWESLGHSQEELRDILSKTTNSVDVEAVKKQLTDYHAREVEAVRSDLSEKLSQAQNEAASLRSKFKEQTKHAKISELLKAEKIIPEQADLAILELSRQFDVDEHDELYEVDQDGKPTYGDLKVVIKNHKSKRPVLYQGTVEVGSNMGKASDKRFTPQAKWEEAYRAAEKSGNVAQMIALKRARNV